MSKGGRYLQKKPPRETKSAGSGAKMSKGKKTALIVMIVVLAILIALIAGGIYYVNSMLNLVRRPEHVEQTVSEEELEKYIGVIEEEPEAETEPTETEPVTYGETGKIVNVLVIGQSSREGEDSKLSDTMILCTINKETKTLTLTSFLRDTYVQLPTPYKGHTCGKNRINTAYALGYLWGKEAEAMEYMDLTILNNFGVQVDYNVEIDFDAFEKIIDLMDGVKLDLDADEAKYMNDFFSEYDSYKKQFKEGSNLANGWEALVYARMRHSSGADNDFKRTNRQRILISKLVDKCKRRTLTQLNDIAKEVLPYILTDMSNEDITNCMLELIPIMAELEVVSNQCPAPETFWGEVVTIADVESGVLKFDVEKNKQILMDIAEADRFDPVG